MIKIKTKILILDGKVKYSLPDSTEILIKQLDNIKRFNAVSVLCTCVFYIADYNYNFLLE